MIFLTLKPTKDAVYLRTNNADPRERFQRLRHVRNVIFEQRAIEYSRLGAEGTLRYLTLRKRAERLNTYQRRLENALTHCYRAHA